MTTGAIEHLADRLRQHLKNKQASVHPLEGHPLTGQQDYATDLYIRMLCIVAQCGERLQEEHLLLLERLLWGVNAGKSLPEYMRAAIDADEQLLDEFIGCYRDHPLKYPFLADCLVLTHASGGGGSERQLELIAELAEHLRLTAAEVRYLAALARSILEQDSAKYAKAEASRPAGLDFRSFLHYTRSYVEWMQHADEKSLFVFSQEKKNFDLRAWLVPNVKTSRLTLTQREIYWENLTIDSYSLSFQGNATVHIRHCEFVGSGYPLTFTNCARLVFEHCTFRNFNKRTIVVENVEHIEIASCEFLNCKYKYNVWQNWSEIGSVVYSSKPELIRHCAMDACEFTDCGGTNEQTTNGTAILSNCATVVSRSKIANCWHFYSHVNLDPDNPKRTLFPKTTKNVDNQVIVSANFQ